jgi:hypothetical protein
MKTIRALRGSLSTVETADEGFPGISVQMSCGNPRRLCQGLASYLGAYRPDVDRRGTMKRFLATVAGVICCLLSTDVLAAATSYHGSLCQPYNGSAYGALYNQYGVTNNSSSALSVLCPLTLAGQAIPTQVAISFYDRNPIENITCTARILDNTGDAVWQNSAGSSGFGVQRQVVYIAVPGSTYWNSARTLFVQCDVPGNFGGLSVIEGFQVVHS